MVYARIMKVMESGKVYSWGQIINALRALGTPSSLGEKMLWDGVNSGEIKQVNVPGNVNQHFTLVS